MRNPAASRAWFLDAQRARDEARGVRYSTSPLARTSSQLPGLPVVLVIDRLRGFGVVWAGFVAIGLEQASAELEAPTVVAVGEEAKATDPSEALRQDMLREASRGRGHHCKPQAAA